MRKEKVEGVKRDQREPRRRWRGGGRGGVGWSLVGRR